MANLHAPNSLHCLWDHFKYCLSLLPAKIPDRHQQHPEAIIQGSQTSVGFICKALKVCITTSILKLPVKCLEFRASATKGRADLLAVWHRRHTIYTYFFCLVSRKSTPPNKCRVFVSLANLGASETDGRQYITQHMGWMCGKASWRLFWRNWRKWVYSSAPSWNWTLSFGSLSGILFLICNIKILLTTADMELCVQIPLQESNLLPIFRDY